MKRFIPKEVLLLLLFLPFMLLAFQNCGKGFSASSLTESSSELASLENSENHSAPHIVSSGLKMEPNTNLEFKVYDEVARTSISYNWSHQLSGVPSACQVTTNNTSANYTLNCNKAGDLKVSVIAMADSMPIAIQDFAVPLIVGGVPPGGGGVPPVGGGTPPPVGGTPPPVIGSLNVLFQIPPGTGNNPWNTLANRVEVYVGQTLTVQNADSVRHQLHTGGRPCPHGSSTPPGATFTCVITQAFNPATNGIVYDHNIGRAAVFNMIAYDGAQLYTQNCMGCHGQLAVSEHKNASFAQILNALAAVPAMSGNANLMGLTRKQVEAIAYAMSK